MPERAVEDFIEVMQAWLDAGGYVGKHRADQDGAVDDDA